MKKIALSAAISSLIFTGSFASAKSLYTVQKSGSADNKMPFFSTPNKFAAERINAYLFLSALNIVAPKNAKSWQPKQTGASELPLSATGYTITRNDDLILAVNIQLDGCGAYCEEYTVYNNFDAQTGQHIAAADLFTAQGLQSIARQLQQRNMTRLQREIKKLKQSNDEDSLYQIEMYQTCLDGKKQNADSFYNFQINLNNVSFYQERCSNHAMHALDYIDDFKNTFSNNSLKSLTTPYGLAVLNHQSAQFKAQMPFEHLLTGTINDKLQITMLLNQPYEDNSISGQYYYATSHTPIELDGTIKKQTIELTEYDYAINMEARAKMSLNVIMEKLSGTWQGDGKKLPVEVAP